MPIRRRITIGRLMVVTGLLAVDFALARAVWEIRGMAELVVAILPCFNLMILVAPGIWRPGRDRPFWAGFVAGGCLAAMGFAAIGRDSDSSIYQPADLLFEQLRRLDKRPIPITVVVGIEIVVFAAIFTPPLLLVAWLAGRLSRRYRIILRIERRPVAAPLAGADDATEPRSAGIDPEARAGRAGSRMAGR